MFEVTCSMCNGPARVPFNPKRDKPVYCSNCFDKVRAARNASAI
jgi:CxxC-x17-CxxC domain-containing protein